MTVDRDSGAVSVDVHIDSDLWAAIASDARACFEANPGVSAGEAYWRAVEKHVETVPNIIVDGETRGAEDIIGLEVPDAE